MGLAAQIDLLLTMLRGPMKQVIIGLCRNLNPKIDLYPKGFHITQSWLEPLRTYLQVESTSSWVVDILIQPPKMSESVVYILEPTYHLGWVGGVTSVLLIEGVAGNQETPESGWRAPLEGACT